MVAGCVVRSGQFKFKLKKNFFCVVSWGRELKYCRSCEDFGGGLVLPQVLVPSLLFSCRTGRVCLNCDIYFAAL